MKTWDGEDAGAMVYVQKRIVLQNLDPAQTMQICYKQQSLKGSVI